MREKFKQRLVGVLVLVALALAFIPALFNFEPAPDIDRTSRIPPAPDIEPVEFEEPRKPPGADEEIAQGQMFQVGSPSSIGPGGEGQKIDAVDAESATLDTGPDNALPEKLPPPEKPALTEEGLPAAWVIQVASFSEAGSARQLVDKLNGAGFKAYAQQARVSGRSVHRVLEGPYVLEARAEEQKARIDGSLGVDALVLPFEP